MKLKRFNAEKVYGYLNFHIDFNQGVNFLIGGNGSGKTTALKLINGLLAPNFKQLVNIPFKKINLDIHHNGKDIRITAETEDGDISLEVSGVEEKVFFPSYADVDIDYYSSKHANTEDVVDNIIRGLSDSDVVKEIASLPSPIFLGLDRRREGKGSEEDSHYFSEREMWMRTKNTRALRARRLIRGALGVSLMETEFLVQSVYSRLRTLEERQVTKLRDDLLISAFQYTEFSMTSESFRNDFWDEKAVILERKKEIKDALSKISARRSKLTVEVDKFFDRINTLFEEQKNRKDEGLNLELLTNKAQIDRIISIVEVIDEYKSKIDDVFKPINEFLQTVNKFYEDSGKKLEVDPVGYMVVKRPDGKKCTIEGLSSGERQLLVIFSHAFFSRHNKGGSKIFIIDEPELSLHLRWQEMFSETLFEISPSSQFVMATHSPEIIGENKDKVIKCGNTTKMN